MRDSLVRNKEASKEYRSRSVRSSLYPLRAEVGRSRKIPSRAEIQISGQRHSCGSPMAEKSPWCHAVEFAGNVLS